MATTKDRPAEALRALGGEVGGSIGEADPLAWGVGMKHDELMDDLAAHLRGNTSRMVWTNTQLGPAGSPRPDVFTVDKSFARFAADAYEIKVSLSDLRSDTTSGKWQSYRKFAHRVWFAIPKGLVPLDTIPRECGVIVRSGAGWRSARKPIAQVIDTLPRDTWLKLLLEAHPADFGATHRRAPRVANEWAAQEMMREKLGADVAELFRARRQGLHSYERRTTELSESAASIVNEIAKRRQQAHAEVERSRVNLDTAQIELGRVLGMADTEIDADALRERLSSLRWALQRGGIEGAIGTLQKLQAILTTQS